MLQYSAFPVRNDLGIEYDALREGAGALNGAGALALARSVDTSAKTGSNWLQPQPVPWTSIGGENMSWSQAVIWGSTGGMTAQSTAWKDIEPTSTGAQ